LEQASVSFIPPLERRSKPAAAIASK
jgi:hypothetical protein